LALTATISGDGARALTTANGHVWALSLDGASIQAYDAATGQQLASLALPGRGTLLAADDDQVWVSVEMNDGNELIVVSPS
jgi:hypothetical protein